MNFALFSFSNKVRSPEEYAENKLDEKIDVYSFGNICGNISSKNISGQIPELDVSIRGNSFAEAALASIMDKCFEYFPEKRVDIFWVASILRDAVQLSNRLNGMKTSNITNLIPHGSENYYDNDQVKIAENVSEGDYYYYSYSED